jgi:hypothetical protein
MSEAGLSAQTRSEPVGRERECESFGRWPGPEAREVQRIEAADEPAGL